MQRILACSLAASLLILVVHGCEGSFGPVTPPIFDGGSIALPGLDGGDGGDGGHDGGDGGVDAGPDAGCLQGLFNAGGTVIDGCTNTVGTPQPLTVVETAGCNEFFSWASGGTCTGVFSGGTRNAFDGGCTGYDHCTSTTIPGVITCDAGVTTCTIRVCTGATCP